MLTVKKDTMKLSYKFSYLRVCLIALATSSLFSCSKDESYDVTGDSQNKIFINTQQWAPINAPQNTFSFTVVHTPVGDFGDFTAKIPVRSTRPVSSETKVEGSVDNSLVEAYNMAHGTKYAVVPEGVITFANPSVTIAKDTYLSADSIQVGVANDKLKLLTEKAYLVPVKLTSVKGSNCGISKDYSVAYIVITTSVNRIKPNAGSADMVGTLVSDYSTWTATATPGSTSGSVSSIFDGDTDTSWGFSASPVTMVIDMKDVKAVSGFRLFSQYAEYGSYYMFYEVKVALSTDGVTYDELGTCNRSDMASEDGYQYIGFYGGYEARYVKLTIKWNTWYKSICELGVYTK